MNIPTGRDIKKYISTPTDTLTRGGSTNQPGLLDLVLTNEEGMVDSIDYWSPLGKRDHSLLSFNFNCYVARRQQVRKRFIYEKGDYSKMKDMFWEEWCVELDGLESVEARWKYPLSKLRGAELECVPSKLIDKYAEAHKH